MSILGQLYQKYGALSSSQFTVDQLGDMRNHLKTVMPHEVVSKEDALQFLTLLRKFRESIAAADKLHGDKYPDLLSSLLAVGEDGIYSNNLRFIFELIQNV